jgi:hypothetical protein
VHLTVTDLGDNLLPEEQGARSEGPYAAKKLSVRGYEKVNFTQMTRVVCLAGIEILHLFCLPPEQ